MFNQMFDQTPDGLAVFSETTRAFQAIATEASDYAQRSVVDATTALGQMSSAKSVPEYLDVVAAFSKKAFEENIEQMARISSMYASAASDHARAIQAMMLVGPK